MPLRGLRFTGEHEKLDVEDAQLVLVRRVTECLLGLPNGKADEIGGPPRLVGEFVEESGVLHAPLFVTGTKMKISGELICGLFRLSFREGLEGLPRMNLGVPAGLPHVKAGNAETERQEAGKDTEEEGKVDASHGG
jgi:hypothetical protein